MTRLVSVAAETPFISAYDHRVMLVRDQVMAYSTLDEKTASKIAVHVLHAIDTIPEKIR